PIAPENDPTILRAIPVDPAEIDPVEIDPLEEEVEVRRAEPVLRAEPVDPRDRAPRQDLSAPLFSSPAPRSLPNNRR
ncbi:MAG: hypothetical protein ABIR71_04905, partial [Chthoniobacterales bacterium]